MLDLNSLTPYLTPLLNYRRWIVAYSGGVDSHVLLHLCDQWLKSRFESTMQLTEGASGELSRLGPSRSEPSRSELGRSELGRSELGRSELGRSEPDRPELLAVHVNHGVSAHSDEWERHCVAVCDRWDINIRVHHLAMTAGKDGGDQGNFEERARDLRYGVFESLVSRGDVLLQGHHQNDQIETFLLRAIRGSGPKGLASVPYQRLLGQGCLVRPLLPFGREMIEAYALHHALRWVTDESNVDIAMDRNFIRAEIVPQLQARWPSVVKTITRSAALCRESVELLDELADMDLAAVLRPSVWSSDMLDCVALLELSRARQANLLRYWVLRHRAPLPSEKRLQQVLATVIPARSDSVAMVTWSGWCCQKFSEGLFLYRSLGPVPLDWSCSWNGKRRLDVAGLGFLSAKMKAETLPLTVSFRQGGESMNVAGRGTRSVKRLMQEAGVPPWIRGVVPLVYLGDVLISVGGYYNSDEAEALFEELYFSFR